METGGGLEEIKSYVCQKCFQVGTCNNSLMRSSEEHTKEQKSEKQHVKQQPCTSGCTVSAPVAKPLRYRAIATYSQYAPKQLPVR